MPKQHSSVVGGSTANIMLGCAGARHLIARAPPEKSSDFASVGTALHNAMDHVITQELDARAVARMTGWHDPETDLRLTDDQVSDKLMPAARVYREYLAEQPSHVFSEVRVTFKPVEGSFGTIDLALVFDDRIVLIDWKFGDGIMVSPENNTQLQYYAAAALFTPLLAPHMRPGLPVELVICQPSERNEETVKSWTTTIADLAAYARRLTAAVVASVPEDAPLTTGDHCRWCKGRVICPKLKERAEKGILSDPAEVDGEELDALIRLTYELEPWIKSVRTYAHEAMERGHPVPHWKLVQKRATRHWTDDEAVLKLLHSLDCADADVFKPSELRSVPQIEKLLGTKAFAQSCDELVIAVSSGTTLAPDDDKRPAVLVSGQLGQLAARLKAQNIK